MSRIAPVPDLERSGYTNTGYFKDEEKITNMKRILAHSPASLQAYMQWYPLYGEIKKILGERNAYLYAFAISTAADCGLCATIFRKLLVDAGENPEQLLLSTEEKDLVDFGTAIARYNGNIANQQWGMMGVELPEALIQAADAKNLVNMASAVEAAAVAETL